MVFEKKSILVKQHSRFNHLNMKNFLVTFIIFLTAFITNQSSAQNWKNYMGRKDERMCLTKSCYDSCAALVKEGLLNFAVWSGHPETAIRRISVADAISKLTSKGALQDGKGGFKCPDEATYNECISYKNYGACKSCEKILAVADVGRIIVYYVQQDGSIWSIEKVNGKWSAPVKYKHNAGGTVNVTSPGPGKVILTYVRNEKLFAAFGMNQGASRLSSWYMYGIKPGSDPFLLSLPGGRLELYVKGVNSKELFLIKGEGESWNESYQMNDYWDKGLPVEDVKTYSNKLNAPKFDEKFVFGGVNGIDKGDEYAGQFLAGKGLGGEIKGSAAATAYGTTDRAVFVRGLDDQVWWSSSSNGDNWTGFTPIKGLKITSDPSVLCRKNGEIILFARGVDNKLYFANYKKETGKWSIWLPYGSDLLSGSPKAFSWGEDRIDVVFRNAEGSLVHLWTNSQGYNMNPQREIIPCGIVRFDPGATGVKW